MMAVAIPAQTIVGLVWDAVLLGLVFNRMSRGSPRGKTILFSDRAVVRQIRGRWHFMFQVCEVRKHALMEAHVRVYCVRKDLDHLATGSCIGICIGVTDELFNTLKFDCVIGAVP